MQSPNTRTFGEQKVERLLRRLPRNRYHYIHEPQLNSDHSSRLPDFVLLSAQLGVIVIEVKDWVHITGGDQREIHTIRKADRKPQTYENPVRTAQKYAYHLKDLFEKRVELWEQHRGRTRLKFPWEVMVILPNISQRVIAQFEQIGVWAKGQVIGEELLRDPNQFEQALRALPWKFKPPQGVSTDMLDIVREVVDPSLQVRDESDQPIGTITRIQSALITAPLQSDQALQLRLFPENDDETLSGEAEIVAESLMIQLARGVAGSGKTLTLIKRVYFIAQNYPHRRVLVLTFNKDLAADLRHRIGTDLANVTIVHFHKLCSDVLGAAWKTDVKNAAGLIRQWFKQEVEALGLSAEFLADEFEWRIEMELTDDVSYLEADRRGRVQALTRSQREKVNDLFARYAAKKVQFHQIDWADIPFTALQALTPDHPLFQYFDAVFIDEGQDFAPSWMRVIKAITNPKGDLFICDDPSQAIFRSYNWLQKGVDAKGRSRILRVPFRSTLEISDAANCLIEADSTLRDTEDRPMPDFTTYELPIGEAPRLLQCSDPDSETIFLQAELDRVMANVPAAQIAVLVHHRDLLSRWKSYEEKGVYVRHFEKMKGMEFAIVYVPYLDSFFVPNDDTNTITTKRRKLFTAMTRARRMLTLSFSGASMPNAITPMSEKVIWQLVESAR